MAGKRAREQTSLGAALLLLLALMLTGCGGSASKPQDGASDAAPPFHIPVGNVPLRREAEMKAGSDGLVGAEPAPIIPSSPPPHFLALQDLIQGIGHFATPGDSVTVQVVGVDYGTRRKLISSWDEGRPFEFTLGHNEVIEGLEEGVQEMEVGDRREIVVPPALANKGWPAGRIPPQATSVFLVDLIAAS